jgi:NhaP-type Na+/H+ or K+/H+ antiporter
MTAIKKRRFFPPANIYLHILRNLILGILLIASALFAGMLGYHVTEKMPWIDSFLNAAMILSGMGPAATMTTVSGKLFAGFYALFSGLAFIAIFVIMLSPVIHSFFRKIHVESGKTQD